MARPVTAASTLRQFRAAAERGFHTANPDVAKTASLIWGWSRRVTFPTGYRGFTGSLHVEAPGYQSRSMLASYVEGGRLQVV